MAIHANTEYVRTDERGKRWFRCPRCQQTFSEQWPTQWGKPCDPRPTTTKGGRNDG